jgi:hypothetical protein
MWGAGDGRESPDGKPAFPDRSIWRMPDNATETWLIAETKGWTR